jgi:hypothetical protein
VDVTELPLHDSIARTELRPGSPNPFGPRTVLSFDLAGDREQPVHLAVYDVNGRRVRTLVDGPMVPGSFEVVWDGRSDGGAATAAGVYFVRLLTPGEKLSRKIVRLD